MALSVKGQLNKDEYKSLGITALLTGVGAISAYLLTNIDALNLSSNQSLAVSFLLGLLGKTIQKLIQGE